MPFDKGKKRKLIDTCGHERCYSCMFRNEACPLCTASDPGTPSYTSAYYFYFFSISIQPAIRVVQFSESRLKLRSISKRFFTIFFFLLDFFCPEIIVNPEKRYMRVLLCPRLEGARSGTFCQFENICSVSANKCGRLNGGCCRLMEEYRNRWFLRKAFFLFNSYNLRNIWSAAE